MSDWIWIDNAMEQYRRGRLMISLNYSYPDPMSLFLPTWTWINERFPRLVILDLICIVVTRFFFVSQLKDHSLYAEPPFRLFGIKKMTGSGCRKLISTYGSTRMSDDSSHPKIFA